MSRYSKYYAAKFFILFLAVFMACTGGREEEVAEEEAVEHPYRFDQPDKVYVLPDELAEISGLALVNETQLLCNEDETGHLYLFDLEQEKVLQKWDWGEEGDYEGIALLGDDAYVLKSNGRLFEIRNFASLNSNNAGEAELPANVRRFKTGLDDSCDAEGLCHLPDTNSLLIACKEGQIARRVIYRFTPSQPDEPASPFLEIDLGNIEDMLLTTGLDRLSLNLQKLLDPQGSSGILFPSGIAVHPLTQDLYILSARSRLLVVYSLGGALKNVIELTHKQILQPESITFAPNGDMYIGNEAKGGTANIMKFTYAQQ